MLMRQTLVALALVASVLSACQARSAATNSVEQAILGQERRALDRWSQGDPLGYLDVDAREVTYFDDIGAHTRVDGIEEMRTYFTSLKGKIPAHRYQVVDPKIQVHGDIGILTLRYDAYATDGTPLAHRKATSVYHRTQGEWRLVHAHWSLVKG